MCWEEIKGMKCGHRAHKQHHSMHIFELVLIPSIMVPFRFFPSFFLCIFIAFRKERKKNEKLNAHWLSTHLITMRADDHDDVLHRMLYGPTLQMTQFSSWRLPWNFLGRIHSGLSIVLILLYLSCKFKSFLDLMRFYRLLVHQLTTGRDLISVGRKSHIKNKHREIFIWFLIVRNPFSSVEIFIFLKNVRSGHIRIELIR